MAADAAAKLTSRVTERIGSVDAHSPVEVIVEMRPVDVPATGPRKERIAAVKAGFERDLQTVTDRIAAAGGQVLESAWINQTVRSSIPADALVRVAEDDAVAVIDLPRELTPDDA